MRKRKGSRGLRLKRRGRGGGDDIEGKQEREGHAVDKDSAEEEGTEM